MPVEPSLSTCFHPAPASLCFGFRTDPADVDLRALNKAWKSNKKTATWKKQASKK